MSVQLNYNMSDERSKLREVFPRYRNIRPTGVTIVGSLLVIASALAVFSVFMALNVPLMRYGIEQNYRSFGSYIFFALVGAGLVFPAGVAMLRQATWGRLMYLVAGPIYLAAFVTINGIRETVALPVLSYIVFAVVLNCKDCVEYFTGWVPRDWCPYTTDRDVENW